MIALYQVELATIEEREGREFATFTWLNEHAVPADAGSFVVTREEWSRLGQPTKLAVEVRVLGAGGGEVRA
jgi:hypothetical protein